MIEQAFDENGKCIAVLEWALVDEKGIIDDNGKFIFVENIWIWKGTKEGFKIMKEFIKKIGTMIPTATHAYWSRKKFNNSVRTYERKLIYGG
jgi:hypothetical protein